MGSACSSDAEIVDTGERPVRENPHQSYVESAASLEAAREQENPLQEDEVSTKVVFISEKVGDVVEVASTIVECAQSVLEPLSDVLGPIGGGLSIISSLIDCIKRISSNNVLCVEVRKRAIALYDTAVGM